jgi:hypothetical protein
MVIPILICFGLIAALIIADNGDGSNGRAIAWLIILFVIGLLMWGLIPYAIGFRNNIYYR